MVFETLKDIAKEEKASVAWIVRVAAEKYRALRWPLLRKVPEQPNVNG